MSHTTHPHVQAVHTDEGITKTTTTITEEIRPGVFGRLRGAVRRSPVKSMLVTLTAGAAAAGAGYVAYTKVRDVADIEDVERAAEVAAQAFAALVR